jgi:hypothetical protein
MSSLEALVKQAKQSPRAAETELLSMLRDIFPELAIETLAINTGSEVSLNSVNGICVTQAGRRLFFKFHAEEGETQSMVGGEYYRAELLANLGLATIKPVAVSTKPGSQCLVYEEITAPTAYDVCGAQDDVYLHTGKYDPVTEQLLVAEENYIKKATAIMLRTLEPPSPETTNAPLMQLFSHRLNGAGGAVPRLDLFYTGKPVTLPDGTKQPFESIASKKWTINGKILPHTLAEIIQQSKQHLAVETLMHEATVISHGDDHNGNKFFIENEFVTFDPAFAGRHPALLAPMKGTMHNGPLHPFWYYKPARVHDQLQINYSATADQIELMYNAGEILAPPLRKKIVILHMQHVWQPLLNELAQHNLLTKNWRSILKCASFACPFLAVNMIDAARLPSHPQLSLFNLAQCVEAFHMPEWDTLNP